MFEVIKKEGKPGPSWAPEFGIPPSFSIDLVTYHFHDDAEGELTYEQVVLERVFRDAYSGLVNFVEWHNELELKIDKVVSSMGTVKVKFSVETNAEDAMDSFMSEFGDWDEKLSLILSCPLFENYHRNWRISKFFESTKDQGKVFDIESDADKAEEIQFRKKVLKKYFTLTPLKIKDRQFQNQVFKWLMNEPTGFWYMNKMGVFFFKESDAEAFKQQTFLWNLTA